MNDPLEIRKNCGFLHELNSSAVRSPYNSRNHAEGQCTTPAQSNC